MKVRRSETSIETIPSKVLALKLSGEHDSIGSHSLDLCSFITQAAEAGGSTHVLDHGRLHSEFQTASLRALYYVLIDTC